MMEGYDMLKDRAEWENARERADAITHYGEINEEWQDALDVSDELVREIMAEPVASPADLAIKLSAALPTLDRHEFLDDDMTEQLGWMDRIAARLVTDACKLVGVPLAGLSGV
jgi:hypothetical protein